MKDEVEKLILDEVGVLLQDYDNAINQKGMDEAISKATQTLSVLFQKAQVEAVRAELERIILWCAPTYLTEGDLQDGWNHGVAKYKENLLMKAGLLAQPSKLHRLTKEDGEQ